MSRFDFSAYFASRRAADYSDAVVTTTTRGATRATLTSGTEDTTTDYPCKALLASTEGKAVDGTVAVVTTGTILVLRNTLGAGAVAPASGDKISVGGRTYSIEDARGYAGCWELEVKS